MPGRLTESDVECGGRCLRASTRFSDIIREPSSPSDKPPNIYFSNPPYPLQPFLQRLFPDSALPHDILESKCRALACRTPAPDVPGSPAATLGEGQRQGSAIDLELWPATGLPNTGEHGGLQNLETASSLTT